MRKILGRTLLRKSLPALALIIFSVGVPGTAPGRSVSPDTGKTFEAGHFGKFVSIVYLQQPIRGVITDENENPLKGVSVKTKDQNIGTVTDDNGVFTLNAPENSMLQISYVGYEDQEINVGNRLTLNIRMKLVATGLNEVVVVGYGTQTRKNLTGAVTQIDSKLIESRPVANVSQALQGAVPNMSVDFNDGKPGSSGKLNIRGFTSINGGAPLVLVDGVPTGIDLVNPSDVATISILKDASAAAIYGARAAYGVVLITTKSGRAGKLKVDYSGNYAIATPTTSHDFITDGYISAKLADEANQISRGVRYTGYNDDDYEELKKRQTDRSLPSVVVQNRNGEDKYIWYGNTDWWYYFFREKKPSTSHSIRFSGGTEKISFMLSGRFFEERGLLKIDQDVFKAYNLRSKIEAQITPWLSISDNLQFRNDSYSLPGITLGRTFDHFGNHLLASSVPENPDGTFTYMSSLNGIGLAEGYAAEYQYRKAKSGDKSINMTNKVMVTLTPLNGLTIIGSYAYDVHAYSDFNRRVLVPVSNSPGEIDYILNDYYIQQRNLDQYHVVNAHATYERNAGAHSFKIMGGTNQELKKYDYMRGRNNNLLSEELMAWDLGTSGLELNGNQVEWALLGYFGRFNYNYNNRYLLELNGRYDGSSHFPAESRFGFFPSVSAGWRVSEEMFFKPVKDLISEFKIRASYGSLGNQSLSTNLRTQNYPYIQLMATGQSNWIRDQSRTQYLRVGSPVSPDLTWERTTSVNVGIDIGLLQNRLNLSFDVYSRKTLDMLIPGRTLPSVFGASSPKQNAADLETNGFDLAINWENQTVAVQRPFSYNFGVVLSDFKSYVTRFDNPSNLLNNYYVGQRIGEIWGYTVDGIFASDDEAQKYGVNQDFVNRTRLQSPGDGKDLQAGDLKFADLNGDEVINNGKNTLDDHGDLSVIGNSLPRYSFGITAGAEWNGFDLSVFVQGVGQQYWYPAANTYFFWGPYSQPFHSFVPIDFQSQIWTPENSNAYFPLLRGYSASTGGSQLSVVNDRYLQNTGYIRLKNFSIGYGLPASLINKWSIDRVRIYASFENLFLITGMKTRYIDPQQVSKDPNGGAGSTNAKNYPFFKTYSFGLDITL